VCAARKRKRNVFSLWSSAFEDGDAIPERYTCDGENVSPALKWSNAPVGTKSFALVVSDPDAPRGPWFHWVLYNLPRDVASLPANVALGPPTLIGQSSWPLRRYYSGPCPPLASRAHRYLFKLYALNDTLRLPDLDAHGLMAAMQESYLSSAVIMGRYLRRNAAVPPPPPAAEVGGANANANADSDGDAVAGAATDDDATLVDFDGQQDGLRSSVVNAANAVNGNLGKLRVFKASLESSSLEFCSSDDAVPSVDGQSRVRVVVHGNVQNVYYGQYASMAAVDIGVTGWVKNLDDGTVEVVAQGTYMQLCQMIRWCHTGSPRSAVSNVEVDWQEPEAGLEAFRRFEN
jgi:Raf kinase inhibitor-like YbhB/YbcL family protein